MQTILLINDDAYEQITDARFLFADGFYSKLLKRFYALLRAAPTLADKKLIIDSADLKAFTLHAFSNLRAKVDFDNLAEYFNRKYNESTTRFLKSMHLTRKISGAEECLSKTGYLNQQFQYSTLMWTDKYELMGVVRPKNPKIDAMRETLLRFAALAIAETFFNYIINMIDSWDGAVDYPEVQKYLAPVLYGVTLFLIIGKGIYDFYSSRKACDDLEKQIASEEEFHQKFDRDLSFRILTVVCEKTVQMETSSSRSSSRLGSAPTIN